MEIIFVWLFFASLVGIFANSRDRSFIGFFALSIILSPVLGFIIVLVMPNKAEEKAKDLRRREEHEQQLESIRAISRAGGASQAPSSVADEIAKLAALRAQGALTDSEFQSQKKALLGAKTP